jgi:hypothetical protein
MNIGVDEADAWNEYCMVCHINSVIVLLIYTFLETRQSQALYAQGVSSV